MLVTVVTEKLELLQRICTEVGVHTTPQCLEGVWVVPLYSWYHNSFDQEPDIPNALPAHKVILTASNSLSPADV